MTRDELRAVGRRLTALHQRFAARFGRKEAQRHSLAYLKGLLLGEGRKNVERMALRFATATDGSPATQKEVVALQEFLTASPWESGEVMREVQAVFAEEFVPSTSAWPLGTVGVVDETSFEKNGDESCGVGEQYCGSLGMPANCQVGVFLLGVTPAGAALLDHELYLPREWIKDRARRNKTRVPKHIRFRTKPQIAAAQLTRTLAAGHVQFDWIVADALYGHDGKFLSALDELNQRYVVQVPLHTRVWPKSFPAEVPPWWLDRMPTILETRESATTVEELGKRLPPSAWRVIHLHEGEKGPLAFEFARWRGWAIRDKKPGQPVWVVIRRTLGKNPEYKYYLSNAEQTTPLETLALVTGIRFQVEQFFEEAKGSLGLADYEARGWTSWHHHMSLVALAHLFLMQTRRDLRTTAPALTLPMTLELVRSAMARPQLTEDDAIHLTQYHLERNAIARASHRKSWLRKNKQKIPKPLL
jgi:SRSO17 transposase